MLDEEYVPDPASIPVHAPPEANKARKFTKIEEKLLVLGAEQYGHRVDRLMILNHSVMINDWTSIRDRFLPHKEIHDLQAQIGKLKSLDHELPHQCRKKRPRILEMTEAELSLLIQGTQKYGTSAWTMISKELLPDWTARDLKKEYHRKLQEIQENIESQGTEEIQFFNPCLNAIPAHCIPLSIEHADNDEMAETRCLLAMLAECAKE